jgi:hypothetical protein
MDRANTAHFWRTIPEALRHLAEVEYQRMREYAIRYREAERDAAEAAKLGPRTPGRGPKPGDTVIEPDEF